MDFSLPCNEDLIMPDEAMTKVTFTCQQVDGVWTVYCPQWKSEAYGKTLDEAVRKIAADIDCHNEKFDI